VFSDELKLESTTRSCLIYILVAYFETKGSVGRARDGPLNRTASKRSIGRRIGRSVPWMTSHEARRPFRVNVETQKSLS
jgi:hypothetical protein